MFSKYQIRNLSSLSMLIFGVMASIFGTIGILSPNTMLATLGIPVVNPRPVSDFTLAFLIASSMASFNMGAYYILAALNNMQAFFRWTVPFRCVTFMVFTLIVITGIAPANFLMLGLWELTGAVLTGLALVYEKKQVTTQRAMGAKG